MKDWGAAAAGATILLSIIFGGGIVYERIENLAVQVENLQTQVYSLNEVVSDLYWQIERLKLNRNEGT